MADGSTRAPATNASSRTPAAQHGTDRTKLVVAAIVALGLALRIPGLNESLWLDELFSTRLYLYSAGALFRTVANDLHPPLYSVLMFVWIRLFGDSEGSIRTLPLLFGLGSIALTVAVARRYVPERAALLAALLLAVSPVHIWYSQEARLYSGAVFLTLVAVHALNGVLEHPESRRRLWGYAGVVVLLGLTHFYHIAIIAALAVAALLRGGPRTRDVVRIDVAVMLMLAAYITVKLQLGLTTESGHLIAFTPAALWRLFFEWFLTGGTLWLSPVWESGAGALLRIATGVAALVVLGVGVLLLVRRTGRQALEPVFYLLSIPALLLAMNIAGFGRVYIERSVLTALPFFVIILAAGLETIVRMDRGLAWAVVIALVLVPTVGLFLHDDTWTVYKPNPDWRRAAAYLRSYQDDAEPLIVFAATPASALNYYGLDLSQREAPPADVVGTPPAAANAGEARSGTGRLKRTINELTAFGGADAFPPSFLRGGRHELILLRDAQVDSVIAGVVARAGTARFVVVLNRFWENDVSAALDGIAADARYEVVADTAFLGLDLTEYRLAR